MDGSSRRGVRRHLSLLVSGVLVLVMGSLGLLAGHLAGQQALQVHREDRLQLQLRLAGLVEQYTQLLGAEVVDRLALSPAGARSPVTPRPRPGWRSSSAPPGRWTSARCCSAPRRSR